MRLSKPLMRLSKPFMLLTAKQFISLIEDFMVYLYQLENDLHQMQKQQVIAIMKLQQNVELYKDLVCSVIYAKEFAKYRHRDDFVQFVIPIQFNWGIVAFKDIKPFQPLKEEKQSYFLM